MSALSKLMEARNQFHKRELKKTGWNDFSKFKYLELADFLIPAMEIFDGLKLAAVTSFTKELATMTITDLEDNSSLTITSPFGSAALKACHEVQNIGAVETYQRRYLWVAALEIVEHDALDATTGKKGDGIVIGARPEIDLPEDWKIYLSDLGQICDENVAMGKVQDALDAIKEAQLDNDQRIYLEGKMNSKTRSAISAVTKK